MKQDNILSSSWLNFIPFLEERAREQNEKKLFSCQSVKTHTSSLYSHQKQIFISKVDFQKLAVDREGLEAP